MRGTTTILAAALLLGLAASALAADEEITNKTCPVMEGEEVDPDLWVEYQGKRVYFCCEDCVERFQEDPERYMMAGDAEDHPYGVLHFILVHFPVALSGVAAIAAIVGLVFGGSFFRHALTFCLILAALFAVPAFLTGGEAEEAKGEMTESLHEAVELHETLGTVSMYALIGVALLQLISVWRAESAPLRWLTFVAILAVAGLVAYTGYMGGEVHLGRGHLDAVMPW